MTATISGWGRKNSSDSTSGGGKLQKIEVDLISEEDCRGYVRDEYSKLLRRNLTMDELEEYGKMGFTRTQLCAIAVNKTSCFGDSGGLQRHLTIKLDAKRYFYFFRFFFQVLL